MNNKTNSNKIDNSQKYYHGHIYSVNFIAWESRVNKIAIGTQIICLLEINGKLKKLPYCIEPFFAEEKDELIQSLINNGFPIKDKKKTLEENLVGLPVLVSLTSSCNSILDIFFYK